jgi:cyclophilin family peptidyl-prolyl cis-trans isomerase/protein-disulfide isomerase
MRRFKLDFHLPPPGILFASICIFAIHLAACSPPTTPSATLQSTATRTAPQLGPTSTPKPVTPTPTPAPPTPTLMPLPPISDSDWSRGPSDATVTILVYSDFQCPYCAGLAPILGELRALHADDLRIVFRHYPLIIMHDKASLAGQAAEAAGAQGRFWEMHDLLFERYNEWNELSAEDFIEWLASVVPEIGIDSGQLLEDINNGRYKSMMEEAFLQGYASGLLGTPTLFLNGELFPIEPTLELLEASIRLLLLEERHYLGYPPDELEPGRNYVAFLQLNTGEVVIQLYPDIAPLAVNNFIYLAREGWYDDNPIFRVVPDVLVESGDPSGTGFGDPGYHFAIETDPTLNFDQPGMVAMSSTGPNTNGCQFFINLSPIPEFNDARTIFGRVIEGLEYLTPLRAREPMDDILTEPKASILTIRIEER